MRLVNEAAESLGRLEVLVNLASAYTRRAYNELGEVDWDDALAVDLKASFLVLRQRCHTCGSVVADGS